METFERGLTMLMFMWGLLALMRRYSYLGASVERVRSEAHRVQ
jgi:hypothetical protein